MKKLDIRCVVACRDSSGSPSFFPCTVTATEEQYEVGWHYTVAQGMAEEEGHGGEMLVYDERDGNKFLFAHYFPKPLDGEEFWNVTLHVSLPATSAEDAQEKALGLIDYSSDLVNANFLDCDTVRCDRGEDD